MGLLEAVLAAIDTSETASGLVRWFVHGDTSDLPEALVGLRVEVANATGEDTTVVLTREAGGKVFVHQDGSKWEHVVAEARDGSVVHTQRVVDEDEYGTLAAFSGERVLVWVTGPDAAPTPPGFAQIEALRR